jgi:putative hemolysin
MSSPDLPAASSARDRHPGYTLSLAQHEDDVQAAQRLRHRVFVEESNARLVTPLEGHDIDGFDDHSDHLLAHEKGTGALVATCRLLPPKGAAAAGGLVAEADFDLSAHRRFHGDLVEISRACIHPAHRGGLLVPLMALGVARYAIGNGHTWVGGNCLVPLGERGEIAAAVRQMVVPRHLSPKEYEVSPRTPLRRADMAAPPDPALVPPLVRGALSLGAWVCGEPGYSPRFGTAALYVLMSMRHVDPAHLQGLPDLSAQ